jgi:hypothetical protein
MEEIKIFIISINTQKQTNTPQIKKEQIKKILQKS